MEDKELQFWILGWQPPVLSVKSLFLFSLFSLSLSLPVSLYSALFCLPSLGQVLGPSQVPIQGSSPTFVPHDPMTCHP